MANLAVHDKNRKDEDFLNFFPEIYNGSIDDRIYVKKAVNWALRQIGKRSIFLNKKAAQWAKVSDPIWDKKVKKSEAIK